MLFLHLIYIYIYILYILYINFFKTLVGDLCNFDGKKIESMGIFVDP